MPNMNVKYLIAGQGLAGTTISMRLNEAGISHFVVDDPGLSSSSRIAAGLINPIVLKRLKLVADHDLFLPETLPFYQKWESEMGCRFYQSVSLKHVLSGIGEQNQWMEKTADPAFAKFLSSDFDRNPPEHILAPHGLSELHGVAWLNTSAFLNNYRDYLTKRKQYAQIRIDIDTLDNKSLLLPDGTQLSFDSAILCTGHLSASAVPEGIFTPTRGEVMLIRSQELSSQHIYHSGVFALPVGKDLFKVGATYDWDLLEDRPTKKGLERLQQQLEKFFKGKYEVVEHLAGVRPNIRDRKPLMGRLTDSVYLFNGFGSRGALMAPYLSRQLLDFMENGKELPQRWDINRFG